MMGDSWLMGSPFPWARHPGCETPTKPYGAWGRLWKFPSARHSMEKMKVNCWRLVKNADFGKMRIELVYVSIFQGNSMGRKFIWPYFIEFHWALGFEIWKPPSPRHEYNTTFHRLTQMYMYNVYVYIYIGIMYMLYVDPKCMLGIIY